MLATAAVIVWDWQAGQTNLARAASQTLQLAMQLCYKKKKKLQCNSC